MLTQIPTPQRTNNKVIGEFYPLQKEELIALKKAKLINNTAFIHLALRYENPFCDRPVEIIPKEFALRWGIPESSVYEAIGKLKKLGVLLVKRGKVIIEWVVNSLSNSPVHFQQGQVNDNPEQLWDSRINSEIPESILRSQNNLQDPIINSEMSENRGSKSASTGNSSSLQTEQTIQTFHTSQIAGEGEIQEITNVVEREASTEVLLAEEVNENSSSGQQKPSFGKENNSGRRSIFVTESNQEKKPAALGSREWGAGRMYTQTSPLPPAPFSSASSWRWLPFGPWNIDGKLDRNFQEWLAKKWVAKYGDDIYEAKANVLSYFRNDPAKLPIKWEQYHSEFQARFENIDTRLKNGITVSPEQRLNAIANARAVLPMSEEQQPTTSKQAPVNNVQLPTPKLPTHPLTPSWEGELKGVGTEIVLEAEISDPWGVAAAAEAEVAEAATTKANEKVETYVTDEEGRRYKDVTGIAARQDSEISEEERKTVAAKLSEFISGLSQKMKRQSQPQPAEPKNDLESLNEMLLDPVFRKDSEILGQVKKYLCNGYLADYDDAGYPISVYAF